uniref:ABC transporter permease n=1 Tax=Panagrolaimus davidi TaxID=227884 RepID=A0A914PUP6_9BILA
MFGKLKLMLVKDLKSSYRARWYILVVEILLILIFIPAIWYSFASVHKDAQIDEYAQEEIDSFKNGGVYNNGDGDGGGDGNNGPNVLYFEATDDIDITPIRNALALMGFNLIDFRFNNENNYPGRTYANFTSVSYNPPKLYYDVVYMTSDVRGN